MMSRRRDAEEVAGEQARQSLIDQYVSKVPYNLALGIVYHGSGHGWLEAILPWRGDLVARNRQDVVSTAAIASLAEATCGGVVVALDRVKSVTVINLQVDYLRAGRAGQTLHARAECVRQARSIAFVRATINDSERARVVATACAKLLIECPA